MSNPEIKLPGALVAYLESRPPGSITQVCASGRLSEDYCLIRKDDLDALLGRIGLELTEKVDEPFVWSPASSNN